MSVALQRSLIPRRPLLWLSAALLFLVPTLIGTIVIWAPLLFLCSLLAKFWMEKRDRRLRSVTLKIALAALAFGAVYLSYGSPRGLEPGVTLLVVLGSLKILESHTARDFHVMVMVGLGALPERVSALAGLRCRALPARELRSADRRVG
jgi:hypothetical protein